MLASHCDGDHYGGLWDLLDVKQIKELDCTGVTVDTFYHAGLSWWKKPNGKEWLGSFVNNNGDSFWTKLLDDRAQAEGVVGIGNGEKLHGWWHNFISTVLTTKTRSGQPTPFKRLSNKDNFIPGFTLNTGGEPSIRILGPVEFELNGKKVLRRFSGGDSINTNGVSLLLRIDYGRTRILLTGDLNKASQRTLLDDYTSQRLEFQCDVAKACHHGSEDVSYKFLQAMNPAATIISSGDNEGHDHPRPSIISASATTGYMQLSADDDDILTPLVYSTELARSIDLGYPKKFEIKDADGKVTSISGKELKSSTLYIEKAKSRKVKLGKAMVVGGLIYGLVNVRTDGNKILCATLDEKDKTWRIKSFNSRF
jgi:hypothetical protein